MGHVGLYFVYKPQQGLYLKYKPGANVHAQKVWLSKWWTEI